MPTLFQHRHCVPFTSIRHTYFSILKLMLNLLLSNTIDKSMLTKELHSMFILMN